MNQIINLIIDNKNNISFFLSVISSIGLITTWYTTWNKNKTNLEITFNGALFGANSINFNASLVNKSEKSITVTQISFIDENESFFYNAMPSPQETFSRTSRSGKEVTNVYRIYSDAFPITIAHLSGKQINVLINDIKFNDLNKRDSLIIKFSLSKGKPILCKFDKTEVPDLKDIL